MKVLSLLLLITFAAVSTNINELVCNAHTNVEAKKKCYSDFGMNIPEGALDSINMKIEPPQVNSEMIGSQKNTNRPQRYIGMTIDKAAMFFNTKPNSVNNIIFDNYDYHVLLESSNNIHVTFVQVLFKKYEKCSPKRPVPAEFLYEELDIDVKDLILLKKRNLTFYFSSYLEPIDNIKTSAYCVSDGDYFVITFQNNVN